MPNGRRYAYDFYQISFGPLRLKDRVALGAGAASIAFGKDGRFKRKRSGGKRNRPRLENDDS